MVDFKKDTWLYALIAAVLAIISIFTPWGSYTLAITGQTVNIQTWLGGVVSYYESEIAGIPEGWNGSGLSLYTFAFVIASITLLLYFSIRTFRGTEFKWDWLVYLLTGVVMLIFTILTLALEAVEDATIGFAPIGLIFSSVLAIIAFIFEKFGDKLFGRGE